VKDCIEKIPHCLERDKELVEDIFNLPISESALRGRGWVKLPSEEVEAEWIGEMIDEYGFEWIIPAVIDRIIAKLKEPTDGK
jgi:hypothetical protein